MTEAEQDKLKSFRLVDYYGEPISIEPVYDVSQQNPVYYATYRMDTLLNKIPGEGDVSVKVEAIKELAGKCSDEFVKAWILQQADILEATV